MHFEMDLARNGDNLANVHIKSFYTYFIYCTIKKDCGLGHSLGLFF
uniref:Uncharacterized protein n=1 Tax=Anguilla anguilla TaxID=7936 RepID=A0A0E9T260_ANGAN